jgi:hypothetical protein
MQALADVAAEERGELVDGEAREGLLPLLLEVASEPTAEVAFDQRPSQRPQIAGTGADPIDGAVKMGIRRECFRAVEPQVNLVGEADGSASAAAILAGSAGTKRGIPAASTLVGTVTMTARARNSPRGVSMVTSRPRWSMTCAGQSSAMSSPAPVAAMSVP